MTRNYAPVGRRNLTISTGRDKFFFLCVGGRSPPTPHEMRKGHVAMPRALFAFHEAWEAWGVVGWGLLVGFGWSVCLWWIMLPFSRVGPGDGVRPFGLNMSDQPRFT